ncbi:MULTISPECIES: acyl carrier protein [Providencia]|uniref:acyl carrier protein n=1 Tax=Providencia TaxID=586 RepID=UPI001BD22281|nr:acyl carrier protein [Providencia rettgeri]ELR5074272.1 acyl carrier protein [Providencia stuartii]ELR5071706.1 acyl carrier protein [Providencia rettgeri]ELR5222074.1 acyl carrier protein [Providencia rettgeri]MDX7321943.1 acyl carrier protein [Providencia rettgeri]UPS63130.1 acyl carrier protein [Providencia rettgeri]
MKNEHAAIHWQWLSEQIQSIRAYSGIENTYTIDSELIRDVHIDSLELLELITAIEQYTGQPISDEVWMKWHNFRDIVEYLVSVI